MKIVAIILQPFIVFSLALSFLIFILPVSLMVLPFSQPIRLKVTSYFWRGFFQFVLKVVLMSRVIKIDEREEDVKKLILPPGVYLGNHQSLVDIPMMFSNIIIPPIMKKSILYIPIFGICAYSSGALIVNRNKGKSRKKAFTMATKRLLEGYRQIQFYPEGTRTKSGIPKPFSEIKTTLLHFAYEHQIKAYPVSLYGTRNVMQNKLIYPFQKLGIYFHAAVDPKNFTSGEDFAKACWQKVLEGRNQLESMIEGN